MDTYRVVGGSQSPMPARASSLGREATLWLLRRSCRRGHRDRLAGRAPYARRSRRPVGFEKRIRLGSAAWTALKRNAEHGQERLNGSLPLRVDGALKARERR